MFAAEIAASQEIIHQITADFFLHIFTPRRAGCGQPKPENAGLGEYLREAEQAALKQDRRDIPLPLIQAQPIHIHRKNRVTLIGCPKLDPVDNREKLGAIIKRNNIKSLTIVRMSVPCCGGLERAAKEALQSSGKFIPWQVVTVSTEGDIVED